MNPGPLGPCCERCGAAPHDGLCAPPRHVAKGSAKFVLGVARMVDECERVAWREAFICWFHHRVLCRIGVHAPVVVPAYLLNPKLEPLWDGTQWESACYYCAGPIE
jgi:hypothetical protein